MGWVSTSNVILTMTTSTAIGQLSIFSLGKTGVALGHMGEISTDKKWVSCRVMPTKSDEILNPGSAVNVAAAHRSSRTTRALVRRLRNSCVTADQNNELSYRVT